MVEYKCDVCGKIAFAKTTRSKYCSKECKNKHDADTARAKYREVHDIDNRVCRQCGKPIKEGFSFYCSAYCQEKYNWTRQNKRRSKFVKEDIINHCPWCGKEILTDNIKNRKYCSDKCRYMHHYHLDLDEKTYTAVLEEKENERRNGKIEKLKIETEKERQRIKQMKSTAFDYFSEIKQCPICGTAFINYPWQFGQVYCSDKCCKRANRSQSKRFKDRCSSSQYVDKDISVKKLFERDNGKCYICGCKCNFNDAIYTTGSDGRKAFIAGDTYPSVDHVYPLSKGGLHSWDNVRLACFRCNSNKRDLIDEQEIRNRTSRSTAATI